MISTAATNRGVLIEGDILSDTHAVSSESYRNYNPKKKPKVRAPRDAREYSSPVSRRPPAPSKRKQMLVELATFGTRRV